MGLLASGVRQWRHRWRGGGDGDCCHRRDHCVCHGGSLPNCRRLVCYDLLSCVPFIPSSSITYPTHSCTKVIASGHIAVHRWSDFAPQGRDIWFAPLCPNITTPQPTLSSVVRSHLFGPAFRNVALLSYNECTLSNHKSADKIEIRVQIYLDEVITPSPQIYRCGNCRIT
jgi:hypothetical protein